MLFAAVLAFPLAMTAFAIADHISTPYLVRCFIAPGYALTVDPLFDAVLHGFGWRTSLGISLGTALTVNFIYYGLFLYWALALIARRYSRFAPASQRGTSHSATFR
jgi:hypothetical protein